MKGRLPGIMTTMSQLPGGVTVTGSDPSPPNASMPTWRQEVMLQEDPGLPGHNLHSMMIG